MSNILGQLEKDAEKIVKLAIRVIKKAGHVMADRLTIMKVAYLIEREYYLRTRKRLTSLSYSNYYYGPYNEFVMIALEQLANTRNIRKMDDYTYDLSLINIEDTPSLLEEVEKKVINIIRKKSSFTLVDYIHTLKEVKGTPFGEEISFEKISN